MQIIHPLADMTRWSEDVLIRGETIALVPTMGYFHEGHLSLMRLAGRLADHVVVSLFVNSIQFAPGEDLNRYPRDLENDTRLAANEKVDVLFVPSDSEMYENGGTTRVRVEGITAVLCGRQRPSHFEGVTTVVAKLFNITKPHFAVFGEKDFQQLAVIRRMTRDLNWNIDIVGHPIVRESDGLAMSSRNAYLSGEERQSACCLYRAIEQARASFAAGVRDVPRLQAEVRDTLLANPDVSIDYIALVDQHSLAAIEEADAETVLALAVRVGTTRLIDNGFLAGDTEKSN
jgi:pantoate--beta-alanine ligase